MKLLSRCSALMFFAAAFACGVPDFTFAAPDAGDAIDRDSGSSPLDAQSELDAADATPSPCPTGEVAVSTALGTHCYSFTSAFVECGKACVGLDKDVHLAAFETEEEDLKVTAAMAPFYPETAEYRYWIGLVPIAGTPTSDAAGFRWITGATVDYSRWSPGEPRGTPDSTCVLQDPLLARTAADAAPPSWADHRVIVNGVPEIKLALCERDLR